MKKFAAHYIFPISKSPIRKGIVKAKEDGTILEVIDNNGEFQEEAGLEFHNGIVCPSFVIPPTNFSLVKFLESIPEMKEMTSISINDLQNEKSTFLKIKQIQLQGDSISLEKLIKLFTLDLATFLDCEDRLGSISPHKNPGLSLISGVDYKNLRLTQNSTLKRLI